MLIDLDYNPTPSSLFFISISLNPKEAVSFDCTSKGHRVIKQVLVEKKKFPVNKPVTSQWTTLVIKDGKFIKKYQVKWLDMNDQDWCNNEIWQTIARQPISQASANKLLAYSQLICDNYQHLNKIIKDYQAFETLLAKEMKKLPVKWGIK